MLREPVRGDHTGEARVAHFGDRVVRRSSRPPLEDRTRLLLVEQVRDRRLERLVMHGQRTIDQSRRHEQPLPSGFMMNGSVPESASSRSLRCGALGALVTAKSGVSYPSHFPAARPCRWHQAR